MLRLVQLVFSAVILIALAGCNRCKNVECNNGNCEKGDCLCDDGWSGDACDSEITPDKMWVDAIRVTSIPTGPASGGTWDDNSHPDLALDLLQGASLSPAYISPNIITDASPTEIHTFSTGLPVELSQINTSWIIGIWDFDEPDEFQHMAGWTFRLWQQGEGFPSTITVGESGNSFQVELDVRYQWR